MTGEFSKNTYNDLTGRLQETERLRRAVDRVSEAFPNFGGKDRWNGVKAEVDDQIGGIKQEIADERARPVVTKAGKVYLDHVYTLVVKDPSRSRAVPRTLKGVRCDDSLWGDTLLFTYPESRRHLYVRFVEIQSITEEPAA